MAAEGWLPFRTESPPSSKKAVRFKSELGWAEGTPGRGTEKADCQIRKALKPKRL